MVVNVLQPLTAPQNDAQSRVALGPAFIVALTAWFALPEQAGGYRLAKWGTLGWALALSSFSLFVSLFAARQRAGALAQTGVGAGIVPGG